MAAVRDSAQRAWLLSAFGDERQHRGNEGYEDDVKHTYAYDTHVANWRHVSEGDVALIRDARQLLGLARIEAIDVKPATKNLLRCTNCNSTALKRRKAIQPAYRCHACKATFEEPLVETVEVRQHQARFGSTFTRAPSSVLLEAVLPLRPRPSNQMAMQEVDLRELKARFPELNEVLSRWVQRRGSSLPATGAGSAADEPEADAGFVPNQDDERAQAQRTIKLRRGRRRFRDGLVSRFQGRCTVTGCDVLDVLEAAHINPYRGTKDDHLDNGLLLRADIHVLFDLDLLGIEPETLTVAIHPDVAVGEYATLAGRRLTLPNGAAPSKLALEVRWKEFQANLP